MLWVATLNLRHNADDWDRRAPLAVAELARHRPHLVALQEVWIPIRQAQSLAERINERLAGEGGRYVAVERPKWGPEGGKESVAVLTRLAPLSTAGVDLPDGRIAVSVTVPWNGARVEFVSIHLHWGELEGHRRAQILAMLEWLDGRHEADRREGLEPPWTLVAGDFNTTPQGEAVRMMRERWRSAYQARHGAEPDWTFGTPLADANSARLGLPVYRATLDYIFVPPEVRVADARLFCNEPSRDAPEVYPSDHVGVLATLELGRVR